MISKDTYLFMKLKFKQQRVVSVQDWDALVEKTYGRPYSFQQQEGCKPRGIFTLKVPSLKVQDEEYNDSIPEEVNGEIMGVKFKTWLKRDPKQKLKGQEYDFSLELFWHRNFYPDIYTVANDLHKKGLLDAGEYLIKIDW